MHSSTAFKQRFLKKWVVGLKHFYGSSKNMSFLERKKVIKLSADVAMASVKDGKTSWSRAVISNASSKEDEHNVIIVKKILGVDDDDEFVERRVQRKNSLMIMMKPSFGCNNRRFRSKMILGRSCILRRVSTKTAARPPRRIPASSIAISMVKKRTQVLKSLLPGGESMDEVSLLEEVLDYIISLKAQVEVMKGVFEASSNNITPLNFK